MTDKDLLIALAEGQTEALEQLYENHSGRVLNYALKRGLNQSQAEDVLQIVFLQIWRKRASYAPQHEALAWIYVITRSEIRDYKSREKNHINTLEFDEELSQTSDASPTSRYEKGQDIEQVLATLRPAEAEALRLRYLEEKSFEEIALRLKKSESNVRQIISRALRFLKARQERP